MFEYAEKNTIVNNTNTEAVLGLSLVGSGSNHHHNNVHYDNHGKDRASYAFAVFLNFILTVLCLSVTLFCAAYVLQRYLRRREERDKLYCIISSRYWLEENRLQQAVHALTKMRDIVLFQDVTAYSVVCYKYRSGQFESDFSSTCLDLENDNLKHLKYSSCYNSTDVYWALKNTERFFDSLSLQLLCRGKCTDAVSRIIGPTVFYLARETSLAWSDLKSPLIHKLVGYFSGSSCAEVFRNGLISDNGLASMISSRVPYVSNIVLVDNCFVMRDIDLKFDNRIDLKGKIRFVDVFLARDECMKVQSQSSINNTKQKFLADACQSAKEICIRLHLMSDTALKLIDTKGTPLLNVRHMLRIMCQVENLKKIQSDDKFLHFLMKLYEGFYSNQPQEIVETMVTNATILEVMNRTRNNIIRYLDEITSTGLRPGLDNHVTKMKLEQIEKDLQLHLNYLILKQIQQEMNNDKKNCSLQLHSSSRSPAMQQQQQQQPLPQQHQQQQQHHLMQPADSDISIYTMAQSASYTTKPQAYRKHQLRHIASNPESMDQASFLSCTSSMYATAASLSSPEDSSLSSLQPTVKSPTSKNVTLPKSTSEQEEFETPV